jgi:hypothetical protein
MSIIALRAWYLQDYEPIPELEKRPCDIRLSKKSLLKSALRADFLDDIDNVKNSVWFSRYLEGENIEFYIEGSGGYVVANIDLISHEIYFTKQTLLSQLEPVIFLCHQSEYPTASDILRESLQQSIEKLNKKSRVLLTLAESYRSKDAPVRLNRTMMRKIRRSMLFIADITPIARFDGEAPVLLPSPNVSIETGYAITSKRTEQILLANMQREDLPGQFPFDLPPAQILQFKDTKELNKILTDTLLILLARFRLF